MKGLSKPFPASKIHFRVGATDKDKTKGLALAYIDARDVMERLDEVIGAERWQCEHPFVGCCRIGIKVGEEWVWKSNGAGQTDVEGDKGQYSDSFKRAAVLWGIGRYLYDLGNMWVKIKPQGRSYAIAETPRLPSWAIPDGLDEKPKAQDQDPFKGKKGQVAGLCERTGTSFSDVESYIMADGSVEASIIRLEKKVKEMKGEAK